MKMTDLNMINKEILHTEIVDTECADTRLIEAELKIWKRVEDIACAEGKHPDEVYVDLMVMFGEFIDKKYPTKKYPAEKSAEEQIKKPTGEKVEKTTQRMRRLNDIKGAIEL
jgi:hypothetical protein